MKIEKLLNEKDHKVYVFITKKNVFIQEWIGSIDEDIGYGVLRIRYTRDSEETDKFYYIDK